MKLDDLEALATAEPVKDGNMTTVVSLSPADDVDRAVHALGRFFAKHDQHTAVQLEIDGHKIGYLNRPDFFSGDIDRSKLGEADFLSLPGFSVYYTFVELCCPVDGCETRVCKIHYDERNPMRCPKHPDKMLQKCK